MSKKKKYCLKGGVMKPSVVNKRIVMMRDLNPANTLYGGTTMGWIDEAASIYALELLDRDAAVVTLKISEVLFKLPVKLGDLLTFSASLNKIGRTSLDVLVSVHNGEQEVVSCDVTLVSLDINRRPIPHGLKPMDERHSKE